MLLLTKWRHGFEKQMCMVACAVERSFIRAVKNTQNCFNVIEWPLRVTM